MIRQNVEIPLIFVQEHPKKSMKNSNTRKFVDLSHTIEDGIVTYKGLPAPVLCDYWSHENSKQFYEDGAEFQIGKIEMVSNTGTYLDSPFHRYRDGKDLSELGLEHLAALEGVLIDVRDAKELAIDASYFQHFDVKEKAVLVLTGWSKHWRKEQYFKNHPFITQDAAEYLSNEGAALVGIDAYNIDDTRGKVRPVHTILLGAEIPIVEHLCHLDNLVGKEFKFTAAPPKLKGIGTFPVRAFAEILS